MLKSPVRLVYENCECVDIQPEAIILLNFTVANTETVYCPEANEDDLRPTTYLSKLRLKVSLSDHSKFSDTLAGVDPVEVLLSRRDIVWIELDDEAYMVTWFCPDMYNTPMQYVNAYQDPTLHLTATNTALIDIDATRPRPEYMRGLLSGDYLYIAEYEHSLTYTKRYKLKYPIRGAEEIAVKSVQHSDVESSDRIYYRNIVTDRIEEPYRMIDEHIIWLGNGMNYVGIEEYSAESGFWKLPFGAAQTDEQYIPGRFPVFRDAKFIQSHKQVAINSLTAEMQDTIDKDILSEMLKGSNNGK